MTCDALQTHLLALETPHRVEDREARLHLAACASCRDWCRQLVQMERSVAFLPVPPALAARDQLIRTILSETVRPAASPAPGPQEPSGPPSRRPSVAMLLGSLILDRHASPRRRVGAGLVAGVAAALILFVTGWLHWYTRQDDPRVAGGPDKNVVTDTLVADLMGMDFKLAEDGTPRQRVEAMARVADQLHARTRALASAPAQEDMKRLANLYGRVVRQGIVSRAQAVPPGERREVLPPIALRLTEVASDARHLARDAQLPAPVRDALEQIALAASDGDQQLRILCAEERS
jgi:hypothetical protein